jgi:hypothetical protein
MGRPCKVCTSPRHERVDAELVGGEPMAQISRRYKISVDSLKRHKAAHLSPALTRVALEQDRKSLIGGANVARELRQCLELVARLRGELDTRPVSTVVNVMSSPEFAQIVATIIGTLEPWPDARVAIADRLDAIDVKAVVS